MILTTEEAATILKRKPQTLRKWACGAVAPIEPIRINGRLAWREADILKLLGGAAVVIKKQEETPAKPAKRRGRPTKAEAADKAKKRPDLAPFFDLFEMLAAAPDQDASKKIIKSFSKSPYAVAFLEAERHAKNIGLA